jgi:acetyltransferase
LLAGQPAGQFLGQSAANGLLEAYGIPTLEPVLAATPDEAAAAAEYMGYPVVIKVASPEISHKSDVNGVLLGLENAQAVRQGFATVTQNASQARPEAHIFGAHVQRMLPSGQDVIVGMVRDAQFGPMIMFGSGGIEVEGLKDVAFELAPLSPRQAENLLESTWAGRKLKGFRSLPPADRPAVMQALARLAQLAVDCPAIAEIEINPLRVLPEGQGAFAIDVRAKKN